MAKAYFLPATVGAATVRLLAGLAGLAALAARHRVVLVTVGAVAVGTVAVATVTGVVGHLYMYQTFFITRLRAKNPAQPYPQYAHQTQ